jgi:site-specific DNA-methyltransferase (adenine-specific)
VKPYYERGGVTLYHGDCREVLPALGRRFGLVVTDPPYNEQTHAGAKTNTGKNSTARDLVTFPPISESDLIEAFSVVAEVSLRWTVATVCWQHAAVLSSRSREVGLRLVRLGCWVKPNGMPQITGDRPAQGWEAVAILHREGTTLRWNGGGLPAVWVHNINQGGEYPTQKPVGLVGKWIEQFSDDDDSVLDPFCGSGTTLVAAVRMGRQATGCDVSERACEVAAKRVDRELAQGDLFRQTQHHDEKQGVTP